MLGVRFHSKVRIGARKSIADKHVVTKFELVQENRLQIKTLLQIPHNYRSHRYNLSSQEILLLIIGPKRFHLINFFLSLLYFVVFV